MKIRQERISDYAEVYELVKISFAAASHSDGTEPDYLNELRNKDTFIPELSLVAEHENGEIWLNSAFCLYRYVLISAIIRRISSAIISHLDFSIKIFPPVMMYDGNTRILFQ